MEGTMSEIKRRLTYLFMLVMNFNTCGHGQGGESILWPETRAYERRIETFSFTPDEARNLLVNNTREHADGYFGTEPTFVVGDEYFFVTVPGKTETSLQGFYVNGSTGAIEYRKSAVSIKRKKKQKLPKEAFTEIEKIN